LVPVASIFFSFTNAGKLPYPLPLPNLLIKTVVGAALWAADIESNNTTLTEMTTPKSQEGAKKAQ
jgi:hypothetical protein